MRNINLYFGFPIIILLLLLGSGCIKSDDEEQEESSNHTIKLANVTVGTGGCPTQLTGLSILNANDSTVIGTYSFVSNPVYTQDNFYNIKINLPQDAGQYGILIKPPSPGEYMYWKSISMSTGSSTDVIIWHNPNNDTFYGFAASIGETSSTIICH